MSDATDLITASYKPYAFETFPRSRVWVRDAKGDVNALVIAVAKKGAGVTSQQIKYHTLLKTCEISTDNCETWVTAGVEV